MLTPLSPLLKELFEVSFMKQSSDVTVISLAGVDVHAVMRLITYIYTGALSSSSTKENMLLREIAELLQIDMNASLEEETDRIITSKSKGRVNAKEDSAKDTSNKEGNNTVALTENIISGIIPATSTPIRSKGHHIKKKVNQSDGVSETEKIDFNAQQLSEASPKSPPKRLGGFRSFDTEEIKIKLYPGCISRQLLTLQRKASMKILLKTPCL